MKKIISICGIVFVVALIIIGIVVVNGKKEGKSNSKKNSQTIETEREELSTVQNKEEDKKKTTNKYTTSTTGKTCLVGDDELEIGYMGKAEVTSDDRLQVIDSGWSKIVTGEGGYSVTLGIKVKNVSTETLAVFPSYICKGENGEEYTTLSDAYFMDGGGCRPATIIPAGSTAIIGNTFRVGGFGYAPLGLSKTLNLNLRAVKPYVEVKDTDVNDFVITLEDISQNSEQSFKGTISYKRDDVTELYGEGGYIHVAYYMDDKLIGGDNGYIDINKKDEEETISPFGASGIEYSDYEVDARLHGGHWEWTEALYKENLDED